MSEHHFDWAKWVGIVLLVGGTWTGIVVNYIEWREAVGNTREAQLRLEREHAEVKGKIEKLRDSLDEVKNRKDSLPVIEEKLASVQKQLDRIEKKVWRW